MVSTHSQKQPVLRLSIYLTSGPSSFAVDNTNIGGVVTSDLLNMSNSLGHIVKVGGIRIVDSLALPVGKSVCEPFFVC